MEKRRLVLAGGLWLVLGASALAGPISFDYNGAGNGGVVAVTDFVWAPTSFVAVGGVAAANAFAASNCTGGACDFHVLSHATLTGMSNAGVDVTPAALGTSFEITMTTRFQETVTSNNGTTVSFATTGSGWTEWYWSTTVDAQALTGSGFDNGRLILRLNGLAPAAAGSLTAAGPPVQLDAFGADDFPGQTTLTATGSVGMLNFGVGGVDADALYFLSLISSLDLSGSLPVVVPYTSVDPSDCFTPNQNAATVGTSATGVCDAVHVSGVFAAQLAPLGGYVPNVGFINSLTGPDFDPQVSFVAAFNAVSEPNTLALVAAALFAGLAAGRAGRAGRHTTAFSATASARVRTRAARRPPRAARRQAAEAKTKRT